MSDSKQIPHLIKLLDDESLDVRETIVKELAAFGPGLKDELKKIGVPLNTVQKEHINEIFRGHKRARLKRVWPNWLNLISREGDLVADYKRLESALSILSEFLSAYDCQDRLKDLLDRLALAYKIKFRSADPIRLARFLFRERKLSGDEKDYYNPQNSNLVYVIKNKKGIPISLAAVYMLVGMRLGLKIEGCHFPGHFLARVSLGRKKLFVDCFNGGQLIRREDFLSMRDGTFKGIEGVLSETASAQTMVRRFLVNLIRAYQIREDQKNSTLLIKLFNTMDSLMMSQQAAELTPEYIIMSAEPQFKAGQTVCHVRYGYRGIVVDVDRECKATDTWYYGNQTQPSRYQAWYHVLVDGTDQVTYVAENSLVKDHSKRKITHALLSYFFTKTEEGQYVRNDNPWPETDF